MGEPPPTIDEIFLHAIEIADEKSRAAYVDMACRGDLTLRQQVFKLLLSEPRLGSFMEEPLLFSAIGIEKNSPSLNAELTGRQIGAYTLLQKIGEGGMGAVYLAQQEHPVRRHVALKVIRSGMDTSQVIARFEQERQALALMDHPNITKVLDVGTTDHGLPYLAMELVQGVPITKYCDQEHLSLNERIDLLIPVCQAVQHAHQKGIVHRDIKPSNVLVALYDGRPVPKVIDFGVAKAIALPLAQRTMFTEFGQMVGTLEYMAPEQADMNNHDIDTRADIYSLGVLLYELLTGSPPFTAKELRSAGIAGMVRLVQEVEPIKPSTKISTSENLPLVAANRKLEPKRLASLVQGELDWISLKCLEKDRTRRYETANGLAADLQRYLSNEPVQACPPTARYRFGKFLKRNRGPALAATLLLLVLVGGVVGTSLGLLRAHQSQKTTDRALLASQQQRARAERHYQRAMAAVDRLLTRVGGVRLEAVPHLDDTRRRILEDALEFYREILIDESNDPVVLREVGMAFQRIGTIETDLERLKDAEESLNRAIEVQRKLIIESPSQTKFEEDLLRSQRLLAVVMLNSSQFPEAERIIDDLLVRPWPETPTGLIERFLLLSLRGRVLALTQRRDKAIEVYEEALALIEGSRIGESGPDVRIDYANLLGSLGHLFADSRRFADAEKYFKHAQIVWEEMLHAEPENIRIQRGIALLYGNSALAYANMDRFADSMAAYDKAISFLTPLAHNHPNIPNYMWDLAKVYNNSALLYSKTAEPAKAAIENEKAVALFEKLMLSFPQRPEFIGSYAGSCSNQGKYLNEQQKWAESIIWNSRAVEAADRFLKIEPRHTETRRFLHSSLTGRAGAYRRLNQTELAVKDYRRSLEISEGEHHPVYTRFRPRALAYIGEYVQAAAEAELVLSSPDATSSTFKEIACVYATCFEVAGKDASLDDAKRAELANRYAARSVELLKTAAEKGHFPTLEEIVDLGTNERLQPLRDRADFQELLSDLKKTHASGK